MDFILLLTAAIIIFAIAQKKDFYLVEIRRWQDSTMAGHARNYSGYSRSYLKKSTLKVFSKRSGVLVLHHSNQGIIRIEQVVFTSLDAAQVYFDSLKVGAKESKSNAVEVDLWRVVARTRNGAYVMPPNSYIGRDAVSLARYRPYPIKAIHAATEFEPVG